MTRTTKLSLVRAGVDKPYTPNFNDPRVTKRVETALIWCELNLNSRPRQIKKQELEKAFGPIGNKLGDYLREILLVRSGHYSIENKRAYQYASKKDGVEKLMRRVEASGASESSYVNTSSPEARIQTIRKKYAAEIESLDFKYELKSDRYWHPLQNVNRSMKGVLWKDRLPFNYDIEACAPTLLKQTAQKCGLLDILAGPIDEYLNDRGGYREKVAQLTGLDLDSSKRLINSLFNGAMLAKNKNCMAYQKLLSVMGAGQANSAMELLQTDKQLRMLRMAIKHAWARIASHTKMDLSTSKKKWGLYFALERRVLDAMKEELDSQGVRYFTEHDGFRTDREVDLSRVIERVKVRTGHEVKIERAKEEESA